MAGKAPPLLYIVLLLCGVRVRAQTCETQADFARETQGLNAACCTTAGNCDGGLPTSCSRQCAEVLGPVRARCQTYLDQPWNFALKSILDSTAGTCRIKGCDSTIDADGLAATRCADTRHGATCTSSCRDGFVVAADDGAHRRAQSSEITFTCSTNNPGALNMAGMQALDHWIPTQPFKCVSVAPHSDRTCLPRVHLY